MCVLVFRLLEKFEAYENDPNYFDYLQPVTLAHNPHLLPNSPSTLSTLLFPWRSPATPPTPSVPSSYVPTSMKDRGVGYDRLARSLLSGYPNEVDLVFNVLTVMTFKGAGALPSSEVCRA